MGAPVLNAAVSDPGPVIRYGLGRDAAADVASSLLAYVPRVRGRETFLEAVPGQRAIYAHNLAPVLGIAGRAPALGD
jgi:hypothetical protein